LKQQKLAKPQALECISFNPEKIKNPKIRICIISNTYPDISTYYDGHEYVSGYQ
jgi:hypothetical protein